MNAALAREMTKETAALYDLPCPDFTNPPRSYLTEGGGCAALHYRCPSCGFAHLIPVTGPQAWEWNGRIDSPTLAPSIKTMVPEGAYEQKAEMTCHHFLTDGALTVCPDSNLFPEGLGYRPGPLPLEEIPPMQVLPRPPH